PRERRSRGRVMRGARTAAKAIVARLRSRLADSTWTPLFAKTALGLAIFLGLALVGSGAAMGLLPSRTAPGAASAPATSAPADAGAPEPIAVAPSADAGSTEDAAPSRDAGATTGGVTSDGKVILNLATEEDLRRLPGIGPTRARGIVELRARLG